MVDAWPYTLSQLTGETHNTAQGRYNDCLQTCVSATVEYLLGQHVAPDDVRDWAYGPVYAGYGFPLDAARYLEEVWHIDAEVVVTDGALAVIREALDKGWPVMARTWEEGKYFHWTPITQLAGDLDNGTVTRHQVLGGFRQTFSVLDWRKLYAGWLLVIHQSR